MSDTERDSPTIGARRDCSVWLVACLELGWSRDAIDGLEDLWWTHHDNLGRMRTTAVVPTPAADQQTERRALGELVEADTALQAWCTAKRAEPKAPFDPMASMSSAGFTFKKEPEHDAIIGRLNKAWDSARAACFAGGSPAKDVEAPAAVNQGWQPIETAPKDGNSVLIANDSPGSIHPREAYYVAPEHRFPNEPTHAGWWRLAGSSEGQVHGRTPTHWMPLPAAPIGSDK